MCRYFASQFEKMGGKVILNYEVKGFAETAESKKDEELVPISVLSENKVSLIFFSF